MIRLLFTSGRGPAECRIALGKALEVLKREAEEAGLDLDIALGDSPDRYGPGSAVAIIQGDGRGLREKLDRLHSVGGGKSGQAASQAQELVHRRDAASGTGCSVYHSRRGRRAFCRLSALEDRAAASEQDRKRGEGGA